MLKYVLLATTMCIASPAFAQETAPPDTQQQDQMPVSEPAPAAQEAPQPAEAPKPTAAPQTPAPIAEAAQPTPAAQPAPAPVAAAQPAPATPAQPVTEQSQVAQIVNTEFSSYDKDGNGALDQTEFGAWMIALRVKAQPAFVAESPEAKAWVAAAFTQADADKNASVNATELTSFLTPKPAA
jgi:hypothetical protein